MLTLHSSCDLGAGAAAVCACSPFSSDCMELYKESFCRDKRLWIRGAAACPKQHLKTCDNAKTERERRQPDTRPKLYSKVFWFPTQKKYLETATGSQGNSTVCIYCLYAEFLMRPLTPAVCIWKHEASNATNGLMQVRRVSSKET